MIQITATIENNLAEFAGRQLPFAASRALNLTAVGARDEVRGNLPKRFTLRNGWTTGGVQARTSTKTNLVAAIMAPGYMEIQETGGERRPTRSKLLAAPATEMHSTSVTPKGKRPRALIASGKAFVIGAGERGAGVYQRKGRKGSKAIKLLYWLAPEQGYEERFEFEADVQAHVNARFSNNFLIALATAGK